MALMPAHSLVLPAEMYENDAIRWLLPLITTSFSNAEDKDSWRFNRCGTTFRIIRIAPNSFLLSEDPEPHPELEGGPLMQSDHSERN